MAAVVWAVLRKRPERRMDGEGSMKLDLVTRP